LILVNDKEIDFEGNIKELLDFLKFDPKRVAVLVNGELVKRDKWEEYKVKERDYIEIVTLVGGG
jgi:sulfur carrier protein